MAAGLVFLALAPRLRERGIRTVGEAVAASRRITDAMAGAAPPAWELRAPARDGDPLPKLDSYPYRHRVREVMRADPVILPEATPVAEALAAMTGRGVSSVFLGTSEAHPATTAILTERDLLRALGRHGAEALALPLRRALGEIEGLLAPERFDPRTATDTIAIAATDYAQKAVVLPLMSILLREAPNMRLSVRPVDRSGLAAQMELGDVHMALITADMAQGAMRSRKLFDETYVCVMRRDHPAIDDGLTLERFCALDHGIMSHDGSRFQGATDKALAAHGLKRRVVVAVPSFLILIDIIRQSDLIALLPRRLVENREDLHLCAPPLAVPGFTKILVWHERFQADPAQAWIRERMAQSLAP